MLDRYVHWILNTPILNKFTPLRISNCIVIIIMAIASIASVYRIDNLSHKLYDENLKSYELLHSIIHSMYVCRVIGRDILLIENAEIKDDLYTRYIASFDRLDKSMDDYYRGLEHDEQAEFQNLVILKNIYKSSMIASADVMIQSDDYDLALKYLTRVTPIANDFFASMEEFLAAEKELMQQMVDKTDEETQNVLIFVVSISLIGLVFIYLLIKVSIQKVVSHFINFTESVSELAEVSNIKNQIPAKYFTKDEVGILASVIQRLKNLLLDYSMKDFLTGGLNSTAYRSALYELFDDEKTKFDKKHFWFAIFDMNNLKLINDKLGHIEGDKAITAAHNVLVNAFAPYGKIYRIGGDEFVSILRNCSEINIISCIANMNQEIEKISQSMPSNKDSNEKIDLSIAVGYGEFNGTTRTEFEDNYIKVDQKMYQNKEHTKQARANARINYNNPE